MRCRTAVTTEASDGSHHMYMSVDESLSGALRVLRVRVRIFEVPDLGRVISHIYLAPNVRAEGLHHKTKASVMPWILA